VDFRKKSLGRKFLTKEIIDDINISMALEKLLRELVKGKGLRKIARDLGIDQASLFRSLQDGSNLKLNRIETLLDYFGYDLKILKRKEVKPKKLKLSQSRRRKGDL
jgi:DNA-binding phage protein